MGRNTGRPPYLIRGTIYVFASCLEVVSGTKCNVIEQKYLDLGLGRFSWVLLVLNRKTLPFVPVLSPQEFLGYLSRYL